VTGASTCSAWCDRRASASAGRQSTKPSARPDISHSGTLTGIDGVESGIGLDVQAFALARYAKCGTSPATAPASASAPQGNFFYKVTPSLTGTLTYNTDFSDAPLDTRR